MALKTSWTEQDYEEAMRLKKQVDAISQQQSSTQQQDHEEAIGLKKKEDATLQKPSSAQQGQEDTAGSTPAARQAQEDTAGSTPAARQAQEDTPGSAPAPRQAQEDTARSAPAPQQAQEDAAGSTPAPRQEQEGTAGSTPAGEQLIVGLSAPSVQFTDSFGYRSRLRMAGGLLEWVNEADGEVVHRGPLKWDRRTGQISGGEWVSSLDSAGRAAVERVGLVGDQRAAPLALRRAREPARREALR
eukprot:gene2492-1639_t